MNAEAQQVSLKSIVFIKSIFFLNFLKKEKKKRTKQMFKDSVLWLFPFLCCFSLFLLMRSQNCCISMLKLTQTSFVQVKV